VLWPAGAFLASLGRRGGGLPVDDLLTVAYLTAVEGEP